MALAESPAKRSNRPANRLCSRGTMPTKKKAKAEEVVAEAPEADAEEVVEDDDLEVDIDDEDIEDLDEIARTHGPELAERALAYADLALRRELRGFDRVGRPGEGELLIVLPGADGPRGEIVARRMLRRLREIKLEVHGERRALRMAIGLAAWREGMSAERLIAEARAAVGRERLGFRDALRL